MKENNKSNFTFIDLFSGIGGFRIALEKIGGKCLGFSEIDNTAIETYKLNWPKDGKNHDLGSITELNKLPKHDILVGGVPCQSWSIAGKNKGIEDKRGALWNDVIRLVSINKPKAFVFENVKGLADPRHNDALSYLINKLEEEGYKISHKVLNSFDFGVPQNRDRIFIVGIKSELNANDFDWPEYNDKTMYLYEIIEGIKKPKDTKDKPKIERDLFGERVGTGFNKLTPIGEKNRFFILTDIRNGPTSIHSWDFKDITAREIIICETILKNRRKKIYGDWDGNPMSFEHIKDLINDLEESELKTLVDKKVLRQYEENDKYEFANRRLSGGIDGVYRIFMPDSVFFSTLVASGSNDYIATETISDSDPEKYKKKFIKNILVKKRYKKPSTNDLKRLQGFQDSFKCIDNDQKNIKLFGNSVSVPVIEKLGDSVLKVIKE